MVLTYVPYAKAMSYEVWCTAPMELERGELEAIALLGLVAAARRWPRYCEEHSYDPDRLEFFRVFAARRVRGSIYDALRSADWVSRGLRARGRALREAGQGTGATVEQMAERTGLSATQVRTAVRDLSCGPVSLEASEADPADADDVEASANVRRLLDTLVDVIRTLDEQAQAVLACRFYLGLGAGQTARYLGIGASDVRAMHASSVLTLRQALAEAARA